MNQKEHYLKESKITGLIKDESSGEIMREFDVLRAKTCRYSKKVTKKSVVKGNRKFEDHKNYLEVTQHESKINQLEKIKLMWIALQKIIKCS